MVALADRKRHREVEGVVQTGNEASGHGAVGQVHRSREGVPYAIVDFDAHHRQATGQGARDFEHLAREHS